MVLFYHRVCANSHEREKIGTFIDRNSTSLEISSLRPLTNDDEDDEVENLIDANMSETGLSDDECAICRHLLQSTNKDTAILHSRVRYFADRCPMTKVGFALTWLYFQDVFRLSDPDQIEAQDVARHFFLRICDIEGDHKRVVISYLVTLLGLWKRGYMATEHSAALVNKMMSMVKKMLSALPKVGPDDACLFPVRDSLAANTCLFANTGKIMRLYNHHDLACDLRLHLNPTYVTRVMGVRNWEAYLFEGKIVPHETDHAEDRVTLECDVLSNPRFQPHIVTPKSMTLLRQTPARIADIQRRQEEVAKMGLEVSLSTGLIGDLGSFQSLAGLQASFARQRIQDKSRRRKPQPPPSAQKREKENLAERVSKFARLTTEVREEAYLEIMGAYELHTMILNRCFKTVVEALTDENECLMCTLAIVPSFRHALIHLAQIARDRRLEINARDETTICHIKSFKWDTEGELPPLRNMQQLMHMKQKKRCEDIEESLAYKRPRMQNVKLLVGKDDILDMRVCKSDMEKAIEEEEDRDAEDNNNEYLESLKDGDEFRTTVGLDQFNIRSMDVAQSIDTWLYRYPAIGKAFRELGLYNPDDDDDDTLLSQKDSLARQLESHLSVSSGRVYCALNQRRTFAESDTHHHQPGELHCCLFPFVLKALSTVTSTAATDEIISLVNTNATFTKLVNNHHITVSNSPLRISKPKRK